MCSRARAYGWAHAIRNAKVKKKKTIYRVVIFVYGNLSIFIMYILFESVCCWSSSSSSLCVRLRAKKTTNCVVKRQNISVFIVWFITIVTLYNEVNRIRCKARQNKKTQKKDNQMEINNAKWWTLKWYMCVYAVTNTKLTWYSR